MFIIMRLFIYSHEGLFSQLGQIRMGENMLCTRSFPCENHVVIDKTSHVKHGFVFVVSFYLIQQDQYLLKL